MNSSQVLKNLNSKDSYLAAIQHVQMFEQDLSLAARGQPNVEFLQKVQAFRALQNDLRTRTLQGRTPLRLQGVHQLLEEALHDVIKKVDVISKKSNLIPLKQDEQSLLNADPEILIAQSAGILGTAALITSPFWTSKDVEPPERKDPDGKETGETQEANQASQIQIVQSVDVEKDVVESHPAGNAIEQRVSEHSDSKTQDSKLGRDSNSVQHLVLNDPAINRYVRDLWFLGALLLARHALNQGLLLPKLVFAHRMVRILSLSGLQGEVNQTIPLLVGTAEKAANVFSTIEASSPFSISDMFEHMTSLDAWAALGLMDLGSNYVPELRGFGVSIPGFSLLKKAVLFAPFIARNYLRILPNPSIASNVNASSISPVAPSDAKLMTAYMKDIAYIMYLCLAAQGLNEAAPVLKFAAAHHIYQILRLSNITEELKETMPLVVAGMEKTASLYQKIEAITPSFINGIFENMMSLDAWAAVGLIDWCKGMPGLEWLIGKMPLMSYFDPHQRWQIARIAPLLLGSTLLTSLYSSAGLNFQANLVQ